MFLSRGVLLKNIHLIKPTGCRPTAICDMSHRENLTKRFIHTKDEDKETFPLSKDEAIFYLQDVLEIPEPINLLENDKLAFLDMLIRQTKYKIPLTVVSYFKQKSKTTVPTVQEQKQEVMSKKGGSCSTINLFTQAVLGHLGFRTFLAMGSVHRWMHPLVDSHLAIVIRDLGTPGSKHLFDVGSRYFIPLMSLDFERSSPTYTLRNVSFKLFYTSPGVTHFCTQVDQDDIKLKTKQLIHYEEDGCWEVYHIFRSSQPISYADSVGLPYTWHSFPILMSNIWSTLTLVGYPGGLMVNITQHQCITMTATGHKEVMKIKSKDHLIETITKYFPHLRMEYVYNAANYYLMD